MIRFNLIGSWSSVAKGAREPSMSLYQSFDPTNEFNILRLACGLFLLPHCSAKAANLDFTYKIYEDYRLYPPKAWVFSCIAIELVCATGMVFAIQTRYVALLEAVFLSVAAWAVWRYSKGKWLWQTGGYEYCVFWAICCVVVAMHG
jgi:putative oxidoreductase